MSSLLIVFICQVQRNVIKTFLNHIWWGYNQVSSAMDFILRSLSWRSVAVPGLSVIDPVLLGLERQLHHGCFPACQYSDQAVEAKGDASMGHHIKGLEHISKATFNHCGICRTSSKIFFEHRADVSGYSHPQVQHRWVQYHSAGHELS